MRATFPSAGKCIFQQISLTGTSWKTFSFSLQCYLQKDFLFIKHHQATSLISRTDIERFSFLLLSFMSIIFWAWTCSEISFSIFYPFFLLTLANDAEHSRCLDLYPRSTLAIVSIFFVHSTNDKSSLVVCFFLTLVKVLSWLKNRFQYRKCGAGPSTQDIHEHEHSPLLYFEQKLITITLQWLLRLSQTW